MLGKVIVRNGYGSWGMNNINQAISTTSQKAMINPNIWGGKYANAIPITALTMVKIVNVCIHNFDDAKDKCFSSLIQVKNSKIQKIILKSHNSSENNFWESHLFKRFLNGHQRPRNIATTMKGQAHKKFNSYPSPFAWLLLSLFSSVIGLTSIATVWCTTPK